jgi:hypothetical protein
VPPGEPAIGGRPRWSRAHAGAETLAAAAAGDPDTDRRLWIATLATGLGVALARPLPRPARALLGAAIGVAVGLGSADTALHGAQRIATLLGSTLGALTFIAYAALALDALLRRWSAPAPRIGLCVVASWLVACAVLMLALAI